ncbi:MAG: secretin N-terminal domain-containing protein, partial [Pseudomonadota bacterium]
MNSNARMRVVPGLMVLGCLAFSGCTTTTLPEARDYSEERALRDRLRQTPAAVEFVPPAAAVVETEVFPEDNQRYSFSARDLPIEEAIRLFGRMYDLNIVVEPDVVGTVNVSLNDLPFDEVMRSMLDAAGYYWERRDNIVYVRAWQTRTFAIDYIRLVRTGAGSSQAQVSSAAANVGGGAGGGAAGGGAGGADGGVSGSMSIQQTDTVDFWAELEDQLESLASEQGRVVVNRLAGTVQVSDEYRRVKDIAHYIEQLNDAIYRQVDIEVRIVEVALNDDESLGVDWSRMVANGDGEFVDGSLSTIVLTPAGGVGALPATAGITYSNIEDGLNRITAVVQALQEQGKVDIVSQPHIRTLNNQTALIKVGTDRTFFRKEQSTDTTAAGSNTFATDVPQVVTEGIVLSITPQISSYGFITMDVSPVVTRVSSVSEVLDANG